MWHDDDPDEQNPLDLNRVEIPELYPSSPPSSSSATPLVQMILSLRYFYPLPESLTVAGTVADVDAIRNIRNSQEGFVLPSGSRVAP